MLGRNKRVLWRVRTRSKELSLCSASERALPAFPSLRRHEADFCSRALIAPSRLSPMNRRYAAECGRRRNGRLRQERPSIEGARRLSIGLRRAHQEWHVRAARKLVAEGRARHPSALAIPVVW
jgi:hypothetical protein